MKNLRHKIRPDEEHKYNSPWNIAADFKIDMSFSKTEIAGMLQEYEKDHHTGMNVDEIAILLYQHYIRISASCFAIMSDYGCKTYAIKL
ncbi:MAG: hypothetical protein ACLUD0_00730 [Eubacterium ramulus]